MYPNYIESCVENNIPIVVSIDLRNMVNFLTTFNFVNVNKTEVENEVVIQVKKVLALNPVIFAWYILPEELRPWRTNEMNFLNIVTSTIRQFDKNPIISYSPNNRDEWMLKTMGENGLDYIGKQAYILFERNENRRIIIDAMKSSTDALDILNSENKLNENHILGIYLQLAMDPKLPSDDYLIPTLAKHDIFLSVANGAKFIMVWSLFKRVSVYRTYDLQYKAYADAINEINHSILTYHNESYSLAGILLNSKKTIYLKEDFHTHTEYEISSNLKLVLDINSANHSKIFDDISMKHFEVKYSIFEEEF